jgi:hypothetical protein
MPMLDDVDIAPMHRGDQSHGVVNPRLGGLGGTAGGHGRGGGPRAGYGGIPIGGGPPSSHSGALASSRGGSPTGGFSLVAALGKGKQARVVLDDDELSFDEDEPLQKRLQQLSGAGLAVLNEAAVTMTMTDKEAVDKRAAEEAAAKRATELAKLRMRPQELPGGSPAPSQAP